MESTWNKGRSIVNLAINFTGEMVKAQILRDIWKVPFSLVFGSQEDELKPVDSRLFFDWVYLTSSYNSVNYSLELIKT